MKNGVRWRLSEIQSGLDYLNKMALMSKTGLIICCFLIATEVGSRSIFDNDGKWVLTKHVSYPHTGYEGGFRGWGQSDTS